jgi:hypothetical protein
MSDRGAGRPRATGVQLGFLGDIFDPPPPPPAGHSVQDIPDWPPVYELLATLALGSVRGLER